MLRDLYRYATTTGQAEYGQVPRSGLTGEIPFVLDLIRNSETNRNLFSGIDRGVSTTRQFVRNTINQAPQVGQNMDASVKERLDSFGTGVIDLASKFPGAVQQMDVVVKKVLDNLGNELNQSLKSGLRSAFPNIYRTHFAPNGPPKVIEIRSSSGGASVE